MSTPKVGCMCISNGRMPVLPIALNSYQEQIYRNRQLLVHMDVPMSGVLAAIDAGCTTLFDLWHCDYVAIWDDDDYSPPDRLENAIDVLREIPVEKPAISSYSSGWFCNLETLRCEFVDVASSGHLWGGTMVFNRAAWKTLSFLDCQIPGYDRELQTAVGEAGGEILVQDETHLPIAFAHGKNIATKMYSRGESSLWEIAWGIPPSVRSAVRSASEFLHERGIKVPAPEV